MANYFLEQILISSPEFKKWYDLCMEGGNGALKLPEKNGITDFGEKGQFAVSNGVDGIEWLTVRNGNEVAY